MTNNEKEIWKSLPSVVGVEVSTFGKVRTLDRVVPCRGNGKRFVKGRILKQNESHNGYLLVNIPINGKQVSKRVNRLVAQTFIANPENLPQVNHLDCNRKNNHVENLEFCTASYNRRYQEKFGISSTEARGHPLFAINLATLEVSQFKSQSEASRALGVNKGNINSVIKGKYNHIGGFWFVNDDENADDAIKRKLHTLQS